MYLRGQASVLVELRNLSLAKRRAVIVDVYHVESPVFSIRLFRERFAVLGFCCAVAAAVDVLVAAALVDPLERVSRDHTMAIQELVQLNRVILVVAVLSLAVAHAVPNNHTLQIDVGLRRQNMVRDIWDESPGVALPGDVVVVLFQLRVVLEELKQAVGVDLRLRCVVPNARKIWRSRSVVAGPCSITSNLSNRA